VHGRQFLRVRIGDVHVQTLTLADKSPVGSHIQNGTLGDFPNSLEDITNLPWESQERSARNHKRDAIAYRSRSDTRGSEFSQQVFVDDSKILQPRRDVGHMLDVNVCYSHCFQRGSQAVDAVGMGATNNEVADSVLGNLCFKP
jgi:hypothetical protein